MAHFNGLIQLLYSSIEEPYTQLVLRGVKGCLSHVVEPTDTVGESELKKCFCTNIGYQDSWVLQTAVALILFRYRFGLVTGTQHPDLKVLI